jgi:hypothetical protein
LAVGCSKMTEVIPTDASFAVFLTAVGCIDPPQQESSFPVAGQPRLQLATPIFPAYDLAASCQAALPDTRTD